jgi:hypothetical protein
MRLVDVCLIMSFNFEKNVAHLDSLAFDKEDVRECPAYGPNFADRMLKIVLDIALRMQMNRIVLVDAATFPKSTFPNLPQNMRKIKMTKILLLMRGFGLYNRRGYLITNGKGFTNNCERDVQLANEFFRQVQFRRCSGKVYKLFLLCLSQRFNIAIAMDDKFLEDMIDTIEIDLTTYRDKLLWRDEKKPDPTPKFPKQKRSVKNIALDYFQNGIPTGSILETFFNYNYITTSQNAYGFVEQELPDMLRMILYNVDKNKDLLFTHSIQLKNIFSKLQTFQRLKSVARFLWNNMMMLIDIEISASLFLTFIGVMSDAQTVNCIKYLKDSHGREVDIVLEINECKTNKANQFIIVPRKRERDEKKILI